MNRQKTDIARKSRI